MATSKKNVVKIEISKLKKGDKFKFKADGVLYVFVDHRLGGNIAYLPFYGGGDEQRKKIAGTKQVIKK